MISPFVYSSSKSCLCPSGSQAGSHEREALCRCGGGQVWEGGVFGSPSHLQTRAQPPLHALCTYWALRAYTRGLVPCGPRGISATVRESQMLTTLRPSVEFLALREKQDTWCWGSVWGIMEAAALWLYPFPQANACSLSHNKDGETLISHLSLFCLLRVEITSAMVNEKKIAQHNSSFLGPKKTHTYIRTYMHVQTAHKAHVGTVMPYICSLALTKIATHKNSLSVHLQLKQPQNNGGTEKETDKNVCLHKVTTKGWAFKYKAGGGEIPTDRLKVIHKLSGLKAFEI